MFQGLHDASITTGDIERHFDFRQVHRGEWDGGARVADTITACRIPQCA